MVVAQAHRNMVGELAQVQLEVYARKLMEWPADCVNVACRKTRKWFPTWFDLEVDILESLGDRKFVYDSLLDGRVRTEVEMKVIHDKANDREEYRKKRERDIARIVKGVSPGRKAPRKPPVQKCRPVAEQLAELYSESEVA
ncbi:MAG: hypothetical protein COB36_11530 [Alphaproteobacteria bacterium]|nr:MAG: hypothetical protein COB36_11530 [Alphaproteobacteria bacterium]